MACEPNSRKETDEENEGRAEDLKENASDKEGKREESRDARTNEDASGQQAAGHPESEDIEELKKNLAAAKAEAAETYDRLLRLSAEFENYKKRAQRQMEDHKKYANEELIKDLLSVVDNLERALNAAGGQKKKDTDASMAEGIEMTLNEILKILKKYNVTPVEAKGKPFDPNYHEALMQEETDEYPENTVVGELQKGYLLHDRLIRPAMVVVSKAKSS
ncbi:MAG: nucleotide exchange factor GrpE [Desulfosalsimonas sp.]